MIGGVKHHSYCSTAVGQLRMWCLERAAMARLASRVLLVAALCRTGSAAKTADPCHSISGAADCMETVVNESKPDLARRFNPLFGLLYEQRSLPSVTKPKITYYLIIADVLKANNIPFKVKQKEKSRQKSIELDIFCFFCRLRIEMYATFKACKPKETCKTFTSNITIILQNDLQKISQWDVTTNKPHLQLQSSGKGTFTFEKLLYPYLNEKQVFYEDGWAFDFEGEFDRIAGSVADDITDRLGRNLDDWFDKDVFTAFARKMTSSDD